MKTGHTRTTCPDNWRRYHATISASSGESSTIQKVVIPPKEDLLQNNNPWCCNCAKQGHYVHQCRAYRFVGLKLKNSIRNDNYSCVFNTSHTVLRDMPDFYQKRVCITRHPIPFYQRPDWNTEHTNSLLM